MKAYLLLVPFNVDKIANMQIFYHKAGKNLEKALGKMVKIFA